MNAIELSNTLNHTSKTIQSLKSTINTNPSRPEHFVENARIQTEITTLLDEQANIGTQLLKLDEEAKKRKEVMIKARAKAGADAGAELLDRLPAFADKVAVAFSTLGAEYAELLKLSTEIRQVNNTLMNANLPQCITASVKIEPNSLHKLLKQQFRTSFGINATDVFLPQMTSDFDIVKAVAEIKKECSDGDN